MVAPPMQEFILGWLRHAAFPDPTYPVNQVATVYYDTPHLEAFNEAVEGDLVKHKVRVRWYDSPPAGQRVPVYLELKAKEGTITSKRRKQVSIPASATQEMAHADIVGPGERERTLAEWGYRPPALLLPVVFIVYRRYRFREASSGLGVNYDVGIASSLLLEGVLRRPCMTLPCTILEVKGHSLVFPPTLRGLQRFLSPWTAFSKYVACLDLHVGRGGPLVWPGIEPRQFQIRKMEETYAVAGYSQSFPSF